MHIILLKLTEKKSKAAEHMAGHKAWIKQGIDDGIFLMVGSLQPNAGGMILAHDASSEEINARVARDPFVEEGIAIPEVLEISPAMAEDRLKFLLADAA